jgi:hypothetical protein
MAGVQTWPMRILFALAFAAIASVSTIMCAPVAGAIPGYESCGRYHGYQIDIKNVTCGDAWVVDAYDWESGPKFQTLDPYNCYTLSYSARPQVLSCVSPVGELVVSE